jgi:outer membrane protein
MMFRSLAMRASLVCFAFVPLAGIASAQLKVAVVNSQQALLDCDEMKKASTDLEKKFKPKQEEILKLQNEIQAIEQQLSSNKLTPQAAAEAQAQGQRKQRDATRLSDDAQQEFERDRQDILGKAGAKIQDIVKKLATDKGYDLVLDTSQTIFSKPALDITADVLAAYNKANPVAK